MNRPLRIVYMGTPDFAVPTLRALHDSGHEVLAVVTQPDRPKGRGRKLTPPPVKVTAEQYGIPVLQPETVRTDAFHRHMAELAPDLYVVVAFGQMVPRAAAAIDALEAEGLSCDLIDPRTSSPLDEGAILESIEATGRLVVVDEAPPRCGLTSDLAGLAASKAFHALKAPVQQVCAPHSPTPFSPELEAAYIPSVDRIKAAIQTAAA